MLQFLCISYILNLAWLGILGVCVVPVVGYGMIISYCYENIYNKPVQQVECFSLTRFGKFSLSISKYQGRWIETKGWYGMAHCFFPATGLYKPIRIIKHQLKKLIKSNLLLKETSFSLIRWNIYNLQVSTEIQHLQQL